MKNSAYLLTLITAVTLACLSIVCPKAFALDVNLNGSANLNFNPVNNNKYSAPMANFAPGNVPLNQVDLAPVAYPPPTAEVKQLVGGSEIVVPVDLDVSNQKAAKELRKQQGLSVGKAPEPVADDQEVKDSDIQDFLANYYRYLQTEGLSSSSPPFVLKGNAPVNNTNQSVKQKTSSLQTSSNTPLALQAQEEKLLISNSPTATKTQNSDSP